jgi:hypothetical protein
MPTQMDVYAAVVWFVVGLCVGSGWALGHWLIGRLLR